MYACRVTQLKQELILNPMEATQKRGNVWASIFLSLLETILVTSEIKYFLFPKKHSQNIPQHAYERQDTYKHTLFGNLDVT